MHTLAHREGGWGLGMGKKIVDGSRDLALIFILNSLQEQQNPEGVQAISRGLSEATPPDNEKKRPTTPEGSQQSAHEPRCPSNRAANAKFSPVVS